MLRLKISMPVSLFVKSPSGTQDQICLLSNSCGFVDMRRPLWREDGFLVYNSGWPSPAQSCTLSHAKLILLSHIRDSPKPGKSGHRVYIPKGQVFRIIYFFNFGNNQQFVLLRVFLLAGIRDLTRYPVMVFSPGFALSAPIAIHGPTYTNTNWSG
jgi:hypothetical protein